MDDWTQTASDSVDKSSELDVEGMFGVKIHIQHALTTTAVEQAEGAFLFQFSTKDTGDEDWQTVQIHPMVTGTPNEEALTATEAAGSSIITLASTTGLYTNDDVRWMLILDNVLASSEMVQVVFAVSNTSITILDNTTNAHDTSDKMFDIADSRTYYVDVFSEKRFRVVIDNSRDAGGPQVTWRISSSSMDAF